MTTTRWDLVAVALMFVTGWLVLWSKHRIAHKRLDVARYHAHGDIMRWGKAMLLGRKEVRVCPNCGTMTHDYRTLVQHAEYHNYLDTLADRVAAIEELLAEARGGGPAEEPAMPPWDGLSGELTEHAGAVDVTTGEIEARADEPEPEQVEAFREKYAGLFRP